MLNCANYFVKLEACIMKGESLLKGIQLQNCRSLKDTGIQKLAPITILVGENSSGKSTFLRTFPLIKQSLKKRTSGPILWAGDNDDYVDFGSFKETVTNDGSNFIGIKFIFTLPIRYRYGYLFFPESIIKRGSTKLQIEYKLTLTSKKEDNIIRDMVTKLELGINNTKIEFNFLQNSIFVDGLRFDGINVTNYVQPLSDDQSQYDYYSPEQFMRLWETTSIFGYSLPDIGMYLHAAYEDIISESNGNVDINFSALRDCSVFIGEYLCLDYSLSDILDLIHSIPKNDNEDNGLHIFSRFEEPIISETLKNLTKKEPNIQQQYLNLFKLSFIYARFIGIEDYLSKYFEQVHYIAPLRATAERYYRLRNLAVDEIDYQGKNLAIYINSLSSARREMFKKWTNKYFGFTIETTASEGHLSLKLSVDNQRHRINLSDTGFGYSQILPIITQLWDISTRERSTRDSFIPVVIAIEQPELHLHPAVQAKLVNAFIASINLAKENGYELQIILETHSETIVNCFGRAIAKQKLDKDDISIILFEKPLGKAQTEVKNSCFDSDGFLTNWPYGFFAAGD